MSAPNPPRVASGRGKSISHLTKRQPHLNLGRTCGQDTIRQQAKSLRRELPNPND